MEKLIELLERNKLTILAIVALIITFISKENIISDNLAMLFNGILIILVGGKQATVATIGAGKKMLGAIKK